MLTKRSEIGDQVSTISFWEQILAKAKSDHKCLACDRAILETQAKVVQGYVSGLFGISCIVGRRTIG